MYGSRNFERDLHVLINKTVRDVLSDDDLLNVPAPILEKYFQPALLKAVQKVTDKHFNDNNALTKTKSVNMALSEFQVGSTSPSFADDISLLASGIVMKDPTKASENLKKAATLIGETAQDLDALDAYRDFLLDSDLGKSFGVEALIEVERQIDSFNDVTSKAKLQEDKKTAASILFNFQKDVRTSRDPTQFLKRQDEALQSLQMLPEEARREAELKIIGEKLSDNVVYRQQNDAALAGKSIFEIPEIVNKLLEEYQPTEEVERLRGIRNTYEKAFEDREEITRATDQLKLEIRNKIPFTDQIQSRLQKILNGESYETLYMQVAEIRESEIDEYTKNYYRTAANPTPNGLRESIKKDRPDLFTPLNPNEVLQLNEERLDNNIKYGSVKRSRMAVTNGMTEMVTIEGGKKSGVSYLNTQTNRNAVNGLLGALDADVGIFLRLLKSKT